MIKYTGKIVIPSGTVSFSAGSTSTSSINLNYSLAYGTKTYNYSKNGSTVYTLLNTNALPTTNTTGTNGTGSFTITVSGGTSTIYFILIGAGGSGGSGNQGGGGGSAGEFKYFSISLPAGSYNATYTVGAGNGGSGYVGSASAYGAGVNGYGRPGNNTTLTINGNTYTALGGSPGGPSTYTNSATVGAYGGGCGCNITGGSMSGSVGQIKNHGGNNTTYGYYGGGGGGSPMGNGGNGVVTDGTGGNPALGGLGGVPIASNDSSLSGSPFYNMQDTSGGSIYWCEGGAGSCLRTTLNCNTNNTVSAYGLAGKSAGVPDGASTCAIQPINHSGSGGGGGFQNNGISRTQYAPSGSNGLILIAF